MSLLTLIQRFAYRTGIVVPSAVIGSVDPAILQLKELLEEEGSELSQRYEWEMLINEETHTTTAAENQGLLTTITDGGFRYICNDTIWDRTDRLPIPLIGQVAWQRTKATTTATPRYHYRIRGGSLLITPAMVADHVLAFEWVTRYWVLSIANSPKEFFTVDTDLLRLPEDLLLAGLRWRWKKEKGLEYAQDFDSYELKVKQYTSRDGGKPRLHMDDHFEYGQPRIFVPESDWTL